MRIKFYWNFLRYFQTQRLLWLCKFFLSQNLLLVSSVVLFNGHFKCTPYQQPNNISGTKRVHQSRVVDFKTTKVFFSEILFHLNIRKRPALSLLKSLILWCLQISLTISLHYYLIYFVASSNCICKFCYSHN